jgi:tetratricopeptide (TPR) repeat protein
MSIPPVERRRNIALAILAVAVLAAGGIGFWAWRSASGPTAPENPGTAGVSGAAGGTSGSVGTSGTGAGTGTVAAPSVADPSAIDKIITAAGQFQQQGEPAKAEAILKQAVLEHPEHQRLRLTLSDFLVTQKRHEEAYEQITRALEIGPRDAAAEFQAGTLATMLNKLEDAADHYSFAQQSDPAKPETPLFLAQVQVRLGRLDAAKASLLRAGKLTPDRAIVWGTLAEIALRENNLVMARQHIAKARELEPRVTGWRLIEARTLNRDRQPEEALKLLLALDPVEQRDLPVLRLIGESYGLLQRPGEAAKRFVQASDALASDADLAFDAAQWLERAGDRTNAAVYATRAAALGKKEAGAMVTRLSSAQPAEPDK